jgi:uncharacterized protein (DUF1800 family)
MRGSRREGRSSLWLVRAVALAAAAALGVAAVPLGRAPAGEVAARSDTQRIQHLLSRATFGVRPMDVDAVRAAGIEAWLDRQLHPERIDDSALAERVARFPIAALSAGELIRDYSPRPLPNVAPGDTAAARRAREGLTPQERRDRAQRSPQRILADLVGAKLARAVYSERQLEEVMTDFWFNHFNVFFGKGLDRFLIADYEQTAIRPHIFGTFEDLLIATARHPAMLFYLDNWTSAAPDSVMGGSRDSIERRRSELVRRIATMSEEERERLVSSRRLTREQLDRLTQQAARQPAGRVRGINENYARELLELHTLGVDGGYTQQDVVEVARAFTGWTFVRPGNRPRLRREPAPDQDAGAPGFVFRTEMHDPGAKVVLGVELPAGRGIEDGLDILQLLAHHPTTARFLATKLVERFVSDTGDPALANELAAVFLRTGGDLREVTRALFTSERFYAAEHQRSKVKTPFELVASALRVTQAVVGRSRRTIEALRGMGQVPYTEPVPTGFPAASEDWVNSGAMVNRINFALSLANSGLDGVRLDVNQLSGADAPTETIVPRLIATLLPGAPAALEARIRQELAPRPGPERAGASAATVTAMVLGSPEFQRR